QQAQRDAAIGGLLDLLRPRHDEVRYQGVRGRQPAGNGQLHFLGVRGQGGGERRAGDRECGQGFDHGVSPRGGLGVLVSAGGAGSRRLRRVVQQGRQRAVVAKARGVGGGRGQRRLAAELRFDGGLGRIAHPRAGL